MGRYVYVFLFVFFSLPFSVVPRSSKVEDELPAARLLPARRSLSKRREQLRSYQASPRRHCAVGQIVEPNSIKSILQMELFYWNPKGLFLFFSILNNTRVKKKFPCQ